MSETLSIRQAGKTAGTVTRRHTFRVYPRPRQEVILREWASTLVWIWNCALEQRETIYRDYTVVDTSDGWRLLRRPSHGIRANAPIPKGRKSKPRSKRPDGATLDAGRARPASAGGIRSGVLPKGADAVLDPAGGLVANQTQQLAAAREQNERVARVPALVANNVLYTLDDAYKHMFRRAKAGETLGAPRYKRARTHVRVSLPTYGQSHQVIGWPEKETHLLMLASARGCEQIGPLRASSDLPLHGRDLGEMTIYEQAGLWYASIVLKDCVPRPAGPGAKGTIGLNRGVVHFATLSNGERLEGFPGDPNLELEILLRRRRLAWKYQCNNAGNLRSDGRLLPGRRRNVTREEEAEKRRLARATARAARLRREEMHLIVNDLLDGYETIFIEDFDIRSMTRSPHGTIEEPGEQVERRSDLNRQLLEKTWGEFARILEYKARDCGATVIRVDAKHISRQCPECGVLKDSNPVERGSRTFRCAACGHVEDVDVVAARNVEMRGLAEIAKPKPKPTVGRKRQGRKKTAMPATA